MKSISGMKNKLYTYYGNNIGNAFDTSYNNESWIIIDIDHIEKIDYYAGTNWAGISIIAHEMEHHYYNHTEVNKGPYGELEADYFSGWMLQKLGISVKANVKAILTLGTEYSSDSHPDKYTKAKFIKNGWYNAKNN